MNHFLRLLSLIALVTGIGLSAGNALNVMGAELTGKGSMELHPAATTELPVTAITAVYHPASASDELVVGILLILLGFFLHALILSRESRNVHISVVPRKEKEIRPKELFWMEMRM